MEGKTYIPLVVLFIKIVILPRLGIKIEDAEINTAVNFILLFTTAFFRYLTGRKLKNATKTSKDAL